MEAILILFIGIILGFGVFSLWNKSKKSSVKKISTPSKSCCGDTKMVGVVYTDANGKIVGGKRTNYYDKSTEMLKAAIDEVKNT